MTERGFRISVVSLVLIGAVLSAIALYEHVGLVHKLSTGQSFCVINQVINCDAVNGSKYSSFLGVPIASYGVFFYCSLLCLACSAYSPRGITQRGLLMMTLLAGSVSSVASVLLFLLSGLVIGAYCIICMGMYLVNFALLGVGVLEARRRSEQVGRLHVAGIKSLLAYLSGSVRGEENGGRWGALAVVPLLAIFAAGVFLAEPAIVWFRSGDIGSKRTAEHEPKPQDPLDVWQREEVTAFPDLGEEGPYASFSKGPKDAPIQVVEFADFECPACRRLASLMEPLLKEYEGSYRLTFRNYPLDDACNPGIKLHRYACRAALFARCAGEQGQFWRAATAMFETPLFESVQDSAELDSALLKLAGGDLQLDSTGIAECLSSARQLDVIRREILDGNRVKLRGTPSLWVNGRIVAVPAPANLRKIFDFILKKGEKREPQP